MGATAQGLGWVDSDASGPINCLWQSYEHCETATLVFARSGVDTGDDHTITVLPKGSVCTLSDAVQGYGVNFGRSGITTYTCSGLQQYNGGLSTICGSEGVVYVPRFPTLIGQDCGAVDLMASGVAVSRPSSPDPIACFVSAYAMCQAATLVYSGYLSDVSNPDDLAEAHFVSFQPQNGDCAVSDVDDRLFGVPREQITQYACAGLQPQPDRGLVVSGCGAEGDVHIPAPTPTPTP